MSMVWSGMMTPSGYLATEDLAEDNRGRAPALGPRREALLITVVRQRVYVRPYQVLLRSGEGFFPLREG